MGEYERWIKEFIDSERRYIDDLEVLSQHYKVICAEFNAAPSARLVNQIPEGLTKTEIQLIFQHTPSLLIFHQEIFPDLTIATVGPKIICQLLLRKKDQMLRVYGDLMATRSSAMKCLQEFEEYFDVCCTIVSPKILDYTYHLGIERKSRHQTKIE